MPQYQMNFKSRRTCFVLWRGCDYDSLSQIVVLATKGYLVVAAFDSGVAVYQLSQLLHLFFQLVRETTLRSFGFDFAQCIMLLRQK